VSGLATHLDELVRTAKTPGLQYAVFDRDSTLFEYNGGLADVATQRPMRSDTTLMAYSMSKTVTAAAVLQLVEAGRIGLDDPVAAYLDWQPYGRDITVRQLLTHTSGIPNPIPLRWVHPIARHATFDERAALAGVLRAHPRLAFRPGTKYAYSNIGYWLLGHVVERASGNTFAAYMTTHVLEPLGITPRELAYTVTDPAVHASGYLEKYSFMNLLKSWLIDRELVGGYAGPWLEIRGHYLNGPAFGGLVGSARGFAKFLQDQLRPHSSLFGDATRDVFMTPQQTSTGRPVGMTPGWHVGSTSGARYFYKEGGGGGFHSMMRLYPASGIASVVIANATAFNVRSVMDGGDRLQCGARS
jgi:CubicO group peptidase (beta-lactamase class C family)